jgi:hypothetical protein
LQDFHSLDGGGSFANDAAAAAANASFPTCFAGLESTDMGVA